VSSKSGLILLENMLLLSSRLLTCIYAFAMLPCTTQLTLKDLHHYEYPWDYTSRRKWKRDVIQAKIWQIMTYCHLALYYKYCLYSTLWKVCLKDIHKGLWKSSSSRFAVKEWWHVVKQKGGSKCIINNYGLQIRFMQVNKFTYTACWDSEAKGFFPTTYWK